MEHLPATGNSLAHHFILGPHWNHVYDKAGFSDFLDRLGFRLTEKPQEYLGANGRGKGIDRQTVLYSWMYFGILDEIVGDDVQLDGFLATLPNGTTRVTTEHLNAHLSHWSRKIASMRPSSAENELKKAAGRINQVSSILLRHHKKSGWPLTADMTLSVGILLEAFDEVTRSLSAHHSIQIERDRPPWEDLLPPALEKNMLQGGWCPNHVKMCRMAFGLSATLFAGLMSRSHQRRHDRCSEDECTAYRVPHGTYSTKHVRSDCDCHHTEASHQSLETLTTQGHVPLVCLDWSGGPNKPLVRIVPWKPGRNFIAVSHVWSHGLGNAETNSLPICQLRWLESLVIKTSVEPRSRHYFWIDTLCVLREPQPLRRMAIEGIGRVYELADKVLVLDEELLASKLSGSTYEETLMRINLSGWMRRLWTLHEQVRSNDVYFQFADGMCGGEQLLDKSQNHSLGPCKQGRPAVTFQNLVATRCISIFSHVSRLKSESDGAIRLARLWGLLRWRHLSWASDETVCMANMLGVSAETVTHLRIPTTPLRMRHFLNLFTLYPSAIIFLQVPRLREDGWRWAPASWLHCARHVQEQRALGAWDRSMGTKTRHGLIVSCPCILLSSMDTSLFKNGRDFYLDVFNSHTRLSVKGYRSHRYVTRKRNRSQGRPETKVALLLQVGLSKDMTGGLRGVFVAIGKTGIYGQHGNVTMCTLLWTVQMTPVAHGTISELPSNSGGQQSDTGPEVVEGCLISRPQAWCVGYHPFGFVFVFRCWNWMQPLSTSVQKCIRLVSQSNDATRLLYCIAKETLI